MRQYIFWCSTNGHQDDWFVQAASKFEAIDCFVGDFGYDQDDVKTKQVLILPERFNLKKSSQPTNHRLKQLGFDILLTGSPRIVRYQGKLFKEGSYLENVDFTKEHKVYLFKVTGKDYYKTGHTKNIRRRVKQVLGASPFQVLVEDYFITPAARQVEDAIRLLFKKFIVANEWLELDSWIASIIKVVFDLYRIEFKDNKPSHKPPVYFNALLEELRQLIHLSQYKKKPTAESIIRLQCINDIVEQLNAEYLVVKTPNSIAKRIQFHEHQMKELQEELKKEHSYWKYGDIAVNESDDKFQIVEVQAHAFEDEKMEVTARFLLKAKRFLKSGKLSKNAFYTSSSNLKKIEILSKS
jgi:RNase H-fold protein (predicted Holliday junction resolvase)